MPAHLPARALELETDRSRSSPLWNRIIRNRRLYLMLLPGVLYFVIYKYIPMWGVIIAFQNYQPFLGLSGSQWVGFAQFERFFSDPAFWNLFRNTFLLAVYNLVFFFPLPIILSLLMNELRSSLYKRFVQTLVYVPHFVSWVVIVAIAYLFFSTQDGIVNAMLAKLGHGPLNMLLDSHWFRTMITSEVIWKDTGWGTIIFLAALSGVDVNLYEAARIDGANRWRQIWHVTLPALRSTVVILLILRLGHFLDTGFEQIYLNLNSMNRDVGEVFETYIYRVGVMGGQFSYTTAIGLFKSVIGLVLVGLSNYFARKFGEEGIF